MSRLPARGSRKQADKKNDRNSDVVASLSANEQLLHDVAKVLENCFDGLVIEKIDVEFRSASTNSPLKEALAAAILLTFQDDLKREIPQFIEHITGSHVSADYTNLVTIVFIIVVIYGIEKAWDLFKGRKEGTEKLSLPQIQGNYNTVIQAGSICLPVQNPAKPDTPA